MCLAIPAKVLSKDGDVAEVDFGEGTRRKVNISLVEAGLGQYVIVHAGFAIEVLDEKEAEETLATWAALLASEQENGKSETEHAHRDQSCTA